MKFFSRSNSQMREPYEIDKATHGSDDEDPLLHQSDQPEQEYTSDGMKKISTNHKSKFRRFLSFMGPGFLVSIAYVDPGNIAVDIGAGASNRYDFIWVLLFATMMGLLLQSLAARMGLATGLDLAQQCRKSYPLWLTWILWLMTEVAVICSDIPEIIGSAIALKILFGIKLWIGVLITAADTLLFFLVSYFSVRALEGVIGGLLAILSCCFIVELFLVEPPVVDMLEGFIPNPVRIINDNDGINTAIGIIGAVVMPHNLYLHSALVQTRKYSKTDKDLQEASFFNILESAIALGVSFFVNFAVVVVSGTKFYPSDKDISLEDASNLLGTVIKNGEVASKIFAIALLAAGQSSTMTGTYAGQFVMEGFLNIKMAPWKRNIITRGVAIVPSILVAALTDGSDFLIVFSQMLLSIQLPFALIPLIKITNSERKMGELKNPLWLKILGCLLGLVVIAANIYYVVSTIQPHWNFHTATGLVAFIGTILGALLYVSFALYLALLPVEDKVEEDKEEVATINP